MIALLGLSLLAALAVIPILAQAGGGYDLTWNTLDGGGGASSGGGYVLRGTIGQPDASLAGGNGYTLSGGFWTGDASGQGPVWRLFLPVVQH